MSNYIPQQMIIVKEESDKTGWSYKDGALEPYYVQFGNAWALGMLNELSIIILAKKLGLGSWMNYIEKYGIPPVFVTSLQSCPEMKRSSMGKKPEEIQPMPFYR